MCQLGTCLPLVTVSLLATVCRPAQTVESSVTHNWQELSQAVATTVPVINRRRRDLRRGRGGDAVGGFRRGRKPAKRGRDSNWRQRLRGVANGAGRRVSRRGSLLSAALSTLSSGVSLGLSGGVTPRVRQTGGDDRIFRGVEPEPHSWPWIVKVKTFFSRPNRKKKRRSCGGALIADRFVVTARHCVSWDDGEVVNGRFVTVWVGSHGDKGQDGVKMDVARVLARPDYQKPTCAHGVWCPNWAFWSHRTLTNDIALLELVYPVPPSPKIAPIRLASHNYRPGTTSWVGGWGLDGRHPTHNLQVSETNIQSDGFRECIQQMSPGKMCVLGRERSGPCPGDSGSPLVVFDLQYGPTLVGLVSNGAKSCEAGLPGIYTRITFYLDWIHLAMNQANYYNSVSFQPPRPASSVQPLSSPHNILAPRRGPGKSAVKRFPRLSLPLRLPSLFHTRRRRKRT